MRNVIALCFVLLFCVGTVKADEAKNSVTSTSAAHRMADGESEGGPSVLHQVVMYLPNRVFDLSDIFRVRAQVGPGLSAGVRATKVAQVYLGSHASVYAGLPGPRRKASIPLPVGLESHNGVSLSVLDATADGGVGPDYSPTEIGIAIHPIIFGVDVGFDPVEIIDFVVGVIGFDVKGDDL